MSLLKRLAKGELHSQGEFTIDMDRANSKMSRFQFQEESEFLFHLVGGLFRLGCQHLEVVTRGSELVVNCQGYALPEGVPERLDEHLLNEDSPMRRLAAACQAILAHTPQEFSWVDRAGQRFDYLTDETSKWSKPQLDHVRVCGLPEKLLQQATSRLQEAARYCRRKLAIQGRLLSPTLPEQQLEVAGLQGACRIDPDRRESQLVLVVDEMVTVAKSIDCALPWHGVLYVDERFSLDASLAAVVEDDHFHRLVEQLPATFPAAVKPILLGNRWSSTPFRHLLLPLLLERNPLWTDIQNELMRLPFFVDQNKKPWSMFTLEQTSEPIYHAPKAPEGPLSAAILVEASPLATKILKQRLGERLQEATRAVLQALRRKHNQEVWSARATEDFELPAGRWLARHDFALGSSRHLVGLPDDWSESGGCITLRHQGRFLAQRRIADENLRFEGISEVEEGDINELWDDISSASWERYSRAYLQQASNLVKQLADSPPEDLAALRRPLLRHLARSRKPEDSYFARTRLFPDHDGVPQSLHTLLQAQSRGGTIFLLNEGGKYHPDQLPNYLKPSGLWLLVGGAERDCLTRVQGLRLRDMSVLFEDWQQARTDRAHWAPTEWTVSWDEARSRGELSLLPEGKDCLIDVFSQGLYLGQYKVAAGDYCYRARLTCDELHLQVRLDNQRLGGKRWTVVTNHQAWTRCLQQLEAQARESVRLRCSHQFLDDLKWSAWARRMVLAGKANEYPELAQARVLETRPLSSSLAELKAHPHLGWTALKVDPEQLSAFLAEKPGHLLWPGLSGEERSQLEQHYGLKWECLDSWFARKEKLLQFLARPTVNLRMPGALAEAAARPPLQGWLGVMVPAEPGKVLWLHMERTVLSLTEMAGFHARVSCPELQLNENCDQLVPESRRVELQRELRQQLAELLQGWLQQPRVGESKYLVCWQEWELVSAEIQAALEQQPWFSTSLGWKCWRELMLVPKLHQLTSPRPDLPADLVVLYTSDLPRSMVDRLRSRHPEWVDTKGTEKLILQRQRQAEKQRDLEERRRKMAAIAFKAEVEGGLVGWLPKARYDVRLVLEDRVVPIVNLPPGWTGFVQSELYTLQKTPQGEKAELKSRSRRHLLQGLLPAVLQRIEKGRLSSLEQVNLAAFCLMGLHGQNPLHPEPPWESLIQARWLPTADGTLSSLHQLHQEVVEKKTLFFWEKKYRLSSMGEELTLLLEDPIMVELVTRWTRQAPQLRPKPLLYRDVRELAAPKLSNVREVLEGFGKWVKRAPGRGLTQYVHQVVNRSRQALATRYQLYNEQQTQAAAAARAEQEKKQRSLEELGKGLLTALRRQARMVLQGQARNEIMRVLDRAQMVEARSRTLWAMSARGVLEISLTHPLLQSCLGSDEPEPRHTLCLLLGLVSFINARLEPVTDSMERDFLKELTVEVVGSYRDQIGA